MNGKTVREKGFVTGDALEGYLTVARDWAKQEGNYRPDRDTPKVAAMVNACIDAVKVVHLFNDAFPEAPSCTILIEVRPINNGYEYNIAIEGGFIE